LLLGHNSSFIAFSHEHHLLNPIIFGLAKSTIYFTLPDFTNWFYDYAKQYGVNPYFLIAKAVVEAGAGDKNSKNPLLIGFEFADGTVVYNFFGIGASDGNATKNGAKYAKNNGWTTPQKAIEGGAKFIGDNYVKAGQDTFYTMRYNLAGYKEKGYFYHQYASNIADHVTKGKRIGKRANDFLANKYLQFKIPSFR